MLRTAACSDSRRDTVASRSDLPSRSEAPARACSGPWPHDPARRHPASRSRVARVAITAARNPATSTGSSGGRQLAEDSGRGGGCSAPSSVAFLAPAREGAARARAQPSICLYTLAYSGLIRVRYSPCDEVTLSLDTIRSPVSVLVPKQARSPQGAASRRNGPTGDPLRLLGRSACESLVYIFPPFCPELDSPVGRGPAMAMVLPVGRFTWRRGSERKMEARGVRPGGSHFEGRKGNPTTSSLRVRMFLKPRSLMTCFFRLKGWRRVGRRARALSARSSSSR